MSSPKGPLRWKPKFSLFGIGGSIVASIGILLVLQQRGSVFPTSTVEIVALVIGFLAGVAVPSLIRLSVVRRYNRRFEQKRKRTQLQ